MTALVSFLLYLLLEYLLIPLPLLGFLHFPFFICLLYLLLPPQSVLYFFLEALHLLLLESLFLLHLHLHHSGSVLAHDLPQLVHTLLLLSLLL